MQTYMYVGRFPKDPWLIKSTVRIYMYEKVLPHC